MSRRKVCAKNCRECSRANFNIDDKGYPFSIECLKYKDTINLRSIDRFKVFSGNNPFESIEWGKNHG